MLFPRRLVCLPLTGILLLACAACTILPKKQPPPLPAAFVREVTVTFNATTLQAKLTQLRPGFLTAQFTAPKELTGLTASLEGERISLRYGALQTQWQEQVLPASGFLPLLNRVLLQLSQPQEEASIRREGGWLCKSTVDGAAYAVWLGTDGLPERLSVPGLGLLVELN
ncbi:MAG: hypothetical protein LBQ33_02970 [Oscillospiraceae bacterium]|jgi:hypothetical protein|nr:hypothetical protein [Oscillospiraceae bacterium]